MALNSDGKDISLSILRNYHGQEYKTAKLRMIARCVRLNQIYKNPDELLTDRYRYYIRHLYLMGYISKGEMLERLAQQRDMLGGRLLPDLRRKFEEDTMEEARRRKRSAL